jgi:hypothetical protein
MKNIAVVLSIMILVFNGCASKKPAASVPAPQEKTPSTYAKFSEQSTWVLGYFNRERLTNEPHSEWFVKGYDEYQLNTESINRLLTIPYDGITIKIVLGTWCPDSRKQVPRFMRIIDTWKFPMTNITLIGVDDAKLSPVGEYEKLDIQRVPTFIFYKNNIEAGRIIENPLTSLEQDIVNILTGKD